MTDEQKAQQFWDSAAGGFVQANWLGEDPTAFGSKRAWSQLSPEQKGKAMQALGFALPKGKPAQERIHDNGKQFAESMREKTIDELQQL